MKRRGFLAFISALFTRKPTVSEDPRKLPPGMSQKDWEMPIAIDFVRKPRFFMGGHEISREEYAAHFGGVLPSYKAPMLGGFREP